MTLAIVDTGPLYAAVDKDDCDHQTAVEALQQKGLRLIIPTLVVAETARLIGKQMGADVQARFLASLSHYETEAPQRQDWPRIAELIKQYKEPPLSATDASIIALAERLNTDVVVTLSQRHFSTAKPKHRNALRLLP